MWRLCDLHNHTQPNERDPSRFDAQRFVAACVSTGLDVVAVTDHDHADRVAAVISAARGGPGVEVSTDHGHILALAPDGDGLDTIKEFCARLGVRRDQQVTLEQALEVRRTGCRSDGLAFAGQLLLIGAHVDQAGSFRRRRDGARPYRLYRDRSGQ